jgi:hypothetical protein
MGYYRVYLTADSGYFIGVREINCGTDAEAVAAARQFLEGCDLEVWHRGRRIACIRRNGDPLRPERDRP